MKNLTRNVRSKPENGRIEARRIDYHTEQPHLPLGSLGGQRLHSASSNRLKGLMVTGPDQLLRVDYCNAADTGNPFYRD